jgi:hypothetical protein
VLDWQDISCKNCRHKVWICNGEIFLYPFPLVTYDPRKKEKDERKICSHLILLNFVDRWLKEEK